MCYKHLGVSHGVCLKTSVTQPIAGATIEGIIDEARLIAGSKGHEIIVPFRGRLLIFKEDTDYDTMLSAWHRSHPGDKLGPCVPKVKLVEEGLVDDVRHDWVGALSNGSSNDRQDVAHKPVPAVMSTTPGWLVQQ